MVIYTDGSAHPNPGPGGYGVVVLDDDDNLIETYSRQYTNEKVTNNEMEIKAILYALINYGRIPSVTIYSDSSYCVNIFTNWMFGWARKGWIKSDGNPPENLELIKAYYGLREQGYNINLQKVKGHSNNKWNELADKLATGKVLPSKK